MPQSDDSPPNTLHLIDKPTISSIATNPANPPFAAMGHACGKGVPGSIWG